MLNNKSGVTVFSSITIVFFATHYVQLKSKQKVISAIFYGKYSTFSHKISLFSEAIKADE